jgi:hypothetical protein
VVDCTGLENRRRATVREFESHRFRHDRLSVLQPLDPSAPSTGVTMFDALPLRLALRIAGGLGSVVVLSTGLGLSPCAHAAISGGAGEKDAVVKVARGNDLKGKSTLALGAFRVAFVTQDAAAAATRGVFGGSAAKISAELTGVDHALMQKVADAVYADFLKQAAARGYTLIESSSLVKTSAAYAALTPAENFSMGRLGTFVIPTGQRSVTLPSDARAREDKGTGGFAARFNMVSDQTAKSPAYDAFPVAADQAGAPVLIVTIAVNFANFKASSFLGGSKASLAVGATIDGRNKLELIPSTGILAWDKGTGTCAVCQIQFGLEGQIHSDEAIGTYDSAGTQNNLMGTVTADPAAFEKNVLAVATQAIERLLGAVAAER